MTNNDILIRVRYALEITDLKLVELFALSPRPLSLENIRPLFLREDEPGFVECDGATLSAFLDGLIVFKRGPRPASPASGPANLQFSKHQGQPSNNDILKALRIALELRDDDIAAILALAGVKASRGEITALFRRKDQDNFRPCGDQFLRNFLVGLTKRLRAVS